MAPGATTKTRTVSTKLTAGTVADTTPHRSVDPKCGGPVYESMLIYVPDGPGQWEPSVACPAVLVTHMRHATACIVRRAAQ